MVTPSLFVVTGPPGAGKSTLARELAQRFEPSVLIEGDAFFNFLARGAIDPWLPDSNEQNTVVTRAAAMATAAYVQGGYTTIYDGIVGPWFLDEFIAAGGFERVDYAVLLPTVDRCVARVYTRENHGFTDEAGTRKMHAEFAAATVDPRHVLDDLPDALDAVVEHVLAALESGRLTYEAGGS